MIAHGGVVSGLDSGACALGGVTHYTLRDGPKALPLVTLLPLMIGDTLARVNTVEINMCVRTWADLAGAVVYLVSPASDYVTGQVLWVDGGWLVT